MEEETEERTKELDDSWKQMLTNLRGSGLVKRRGDVDQVRIQVQGTVLGSGIRCLFDPWIRERFFPDLGSRLDSPTQISESHVTIFG